MSVTNSTDRVEIITSVQRRRRWTAPEKVRMVEETFEPGMTVSLVARRHGVAPNQLFTWRRLVAQGSLTAAGSGEEVVPASDYRALQNQVRELHRLLGKKTLEAEILKEGPRTRHRVKKTTAAAAVAAEGRFPMKTVVEVIGVSRSNLADRLQERSKKRDQPTPGEQLVWGDAMPTSHQAYRHTRLEGLFDHANLLQGRPAPTTLNRRDDLNAIARIGHRHGWGC